MQLNSIVFAAPKCTYSSQSLFKEIIYVPRCKDNWSEEEEPEIPMETVTELNLFNQQIETRVCLPMSAGELGSDEHLSPQKYTYVSNTSAGS